MMNITKAIRLQDLLPKETETIEIDFSKVRWVTPLELKTNSEDCSWENSTPSEPPGNDLLKPKEINELTDENLIKIILELNINLNTQYQPKYLYFLDTDEVKLTSSEPPGKDFYGKPIC